MNPNSEVEIAIRAAARGAHAAGVQFSAARRKPRATNFFVRGGKLELGHDGLGGPPKPARGPRALLLPISEFGFSALGSSTGSHFVDTRPVKVPGQPEWRDYRICWWDHSTPSMVFGPVLRVIVNG